jgi:hypothetical protein
VAGIAGPACVGAAASGGTDHSAISGPVRIAPAAEPITAGSCGSASWATRSETAGDGATDGASATFSEAAGISSEAKRPGTSDSAEPGAAAVGSAGGLDFAPGGALGRALKSASGTATRSDRSIVANGDAEARK